MKKQTGAPAELRYEALDKSTGLITRMKPEYITMSRRPGLGYDWFQKYKKDVYPGDFIIIDGKRHKPPGYYDLLMEREDPDLMVEIRDRREQYAKLHPENNTRLRLECREIVKTKQLKKLPRHMENQNDSQDIHNL